MDMKNLKKKLEKINRKSYKLYKQIEGEYKINKDTILSIDHCQQDPFASPSKIKIISKLKFPKELYNNDIRKLALEDFIVRNFKQKIDKFSRKRGTGHSGLYFVEAGGQKVLKRSSSEIFNNSIEIRFFAGLPGIGRRIDSLTAIKMLVEEIPSCIDVFDFKYYNKKNVYDFVNLIEDQEYIRNNISKKKIVAFIGNNSILPRKSGVEDTPLKNGIPFKSPKSMEVEFETLHHGKIKGMGIPEGVTLIVGGGFHGKSTLLNAISHGIYNHIPGDGREWVISCKDTVKVRSEDGRFIEKVDISPFIKNLPQNKDTKKFSTENASGSTSISASIIENIEVGAKLFLIDEDTTATNFLIRDARIQKLIPKEKEPITPFIDKVQTLYKDFGISTIMVIGGSGDYLEVADKIISMENYLPFDKTEKAKKIIKELPSQREIESDPYFGIIKKRIPLRKSFRAKKIKAKGKKELIFGKEVIDISYVEQIVSTSQTRCIGEIINYLSKNIFNEKISISEALEIFYEKFHKFGFKLLFKNPPGNLSLPRKFEVAGTINRLRTLIIKDD